MMHCRFLRDRHGRPVFPIGVNYWPRRTAVEMWTRWDPEGIAQDLQEMRTLGLNTVRFFLMTADFADAEGNLRADALEKLDTFLALCREQGTCPVRTVQGLMTLPTFFVGHMPGRYKILSACTFTSTTTTRCALPIPRLAWCACATSAGRCWPRNLV